MIDVSNIILWRKYYFSLPVERLFQHLLYREVPLIPKLKADNIYVLYEQLDRANDRNSDWSYTRHLVMRSITYIKEFRTAHKTPKKPFPSGRKQLNTYEYIIYEYLNGEVVARVYEPHLIDNLRLFFRYSHHESLGDYLLYEARRGTNLKENYFLRDLADSISFDNWIMNKAINGELKALINRC